MPSSRSRAPGTPVPAWGEETHDVGECLGVVLEEHCEHRRFAERDLGRARPPAEPRRPIG